MARLRGVQPVQRRPRLRRVVGAAAAHLAARRGHRRLPGPCAPRPSVRHRPRGRRRLPADRLHRHGYRRVLVHRHRRPARLDAPVPQRPPARPAERHGLRRPARPGRPRLQGAVRRGGLLLRLHPDPRSGRRPQAARAGAGRPARGAARRLRPGAHPGRAGYRRDR